MKKWIRWPGLAVFAGIVVLLAVFWYIFVDYAVEYAVERTGTKAVGAKVELDSADLSLFPLGLELNRLQVANPGKPMRNAFIAERIAMKFNTGYLLKGQKVVEEMTVNGMAFDTERASSGAVPGAEKKVDKKGGIGEKLRSDLGNLPSMSVENAKEILEKEKLATVEQAKALQSDIAAAREKFQKRLKDLPDENTFRQYEERISDLGGGDNGLMGLVGKAGKVQEIRKDIQTDIEKLRQTKRDLTQTREDFQERMQSLKNAPARDAKRLAEKYGLSPKGLSNISALFFGPKYAGWVESGLTWYQRLSPYLTGMAQKKEKEEKSRRGEGVDVQFASQRPVPEYWIKVAQVSVRLAGGQVDGRISDLTTDQPTLGRPLAFSFSGSGVKDSGSLNIAGSLDHTKPDNPRDHAQFNLEHYLFKALKLVDKEDFALTLNTADVQSAKGDVLIAGRKLDANVAAVVGAADFQVESSRSEDLFVSTLKDTLQTIRSFDVGASLGGSLDSPEVQITSNINDALAASLKQTLAKQQSKFRERLRGAITQRTEGDVESSRSEFAELTAIGDKLNRRLNQANSVLPR